MIKILDDPHKTVVHYLGPSLEAGPCPTFFYFALSGQDSLELHPYSQPATLLANSDIRVISFTIPGHEDDMNKFHAMEYWAEKMEKGEPLLEEFFEKTASAIKWLIEQKLVSAERLATGGLSRGGFVATHIAAQVPQISTLLGFAPLTELMRLKEFQDKLELKSQAEKLNLAHLTDQLEHVKNIRFYIGNLDHRVSTDSCYHFIRRVAEAGHARRLRDQKVELFITQSIGHKGHGTNPSIFAEGALWLEQILSN